MTKLLIKLINDMATQSYEQLISGANKIRQNELPESNTAALVGEQLLQMVNKQQEESRERVKGITEYNVSVHHPTSGTDGTNRYTLETAIVQVPPELRNIGLKVSFINSAGKVETWEFQGGTFTDVDGWTDGTEKIAKLERILFIDKAESVLAFPLSSPKKISYWNLAIPDTTFKKCSAIRFTAYTNITPVLGNKLFLKIYRHLQRMESTKSGCPKRIPLRMMKDSLSA